MFTLMSFNTLHRLRVSYLTLTLGSMLTLTLFLSKHDVDVRYYLCFIFVFIGFFGHINDIYLSRHSRRFSTLTMIFTLHFKTWPWHWQYVSTLTMAPTFSVILVHAFLFNCGIDG